MKALIGILLLLAAAGNLSAVQAEGSVVPPASTTRPASQESEFTKPLNVGDVLESMPLLDGTKLAKVHIKGISKTELYVDHSEGIKKLPMSSIPLYIRKRFVGGPGITDEPAVVPPPSAPKIGEAGNAKSFQVGDRIQEWKLPDGTIYNAVKILAITSSGVSIEHRDGVTSVPLGRLDNAVRERLMGGIAAGSSFGAPTVTTRSKGTKKPPKWKPSSIDDVAACTLFVKTDRGSGTGFLLNEDGVTYVYTNMHVLDHAKEISIKDAAGGDYSFVVEAEVAAAPCGYFAGVGGGDAVRLRLAAFIEKALNQGDITTPGTILGKEIYVVGNSGGRGNITKRPGVVRQCGDQTFSNTSAAEPGNSGSPVVRSDTFEVVGMHTYGLRAPDNPLVAFWAKNYAAESGISYGLRMDALNQWQVMSVPALLKQTEKFDDFASLIRLCGVLSILTPSDRGIFLNIPASTRVMGSEYTVGEILAAFSDRPILKEMYALDAALSQNRTSNLKKSDADVFKRYTAAFRNILASIAAERANMMQGSVSFYMQSRLENSMAIRICTAYETFLSRQLQWYENKMGVGGKTTSGRPELPSFSQGLAALGLR